jgi:hypothetical protein
MNWVTSGAVDFVSDGKISGRTRQAGNSCARQTNEAAR